MPQRLRGQIHFGVCHLRALWRRAVGQVEMLKIQSWRTVVPGSPQSTAHQKRRPNCSIADGTHGARGSGADPQLPCPTTPGGTTSSGPAFLTERHRSPGYVELSPAGSCGRPGTRAGPGGGGGEESCAASPSHSACPAAQFLAGDQGRRGPQGKGPGRLGPRGRWIPRSAHLPTSAAAPEVPAPCPRRPHSEPRAAGTAPPPAGLAARVANRKGRPTTWRHWRRCL